MSIVLITFFKIVKLKGFESTQQDIRFSWDTWTLRWTSRQGRKMEAVASKLFNFRDRGERLEIYEQLNQRIYTRLVFERFFYNFYKSRTDLDCHRDGNDIGLEYRFEEYRFTNLIKTSLKKDVCFTYNELVEVIQRRWRSRRTHRKIRELFQEWAFRPWNAGGQFVISRLNHNKNNKVKDLF